MHGCVLFFPFFVWLQLIFKNDKIIIRFNKTLTTLRILYKVVMVVLVRSMTGYGRHTQSLDGRLIGVEVKSVNHRYLEYSARLPKGCGFLENRLKAFVQQKITRGKVDVAVTIERIGGAQLTVRVDQALADGYVEALRALAQRYCLKQDIDAAAVAAYPEVLVVEKEQEDEEALWDAVRQTAETAFGRLLEMREQEGANLKRDLLRRAQDIDFMVKEIEVRSPQTVQAYKERLQARMKELFAEPDYQEARLYGELVLFTDKVSVAEETVRLRSHLSQMRAMLESQEAVGRKLDFLAQEMNREANTIGAKAADAQIAYMVVDIKAEVEKIREQIQNIE